MDRIPRPRVSVEDQLERYRCLVAGVLAEHERTLRGDGEFGCTCGVGWPCRTERLAAQLLDWV
ncbi:MAG: hypothetical protein ACRDPK_04670 [Carbonactinosporaceae bacterium]